jgi:DNA processing protein
MNTCDYLGDDGMVMLALCSAFALAEGEPAEGTAPFTLSEWNKLARQISDSPFQQPGALHGHTGDDLARNLRLLPGDAERILRLLDRSGRLALELESLFARGMWVTTRADGLYPKQLRETLRHQAPTVLFGAGDISLLSRGGVAIVGSRNIDEAGTAFAQETGRRAAAARLPVISGGARGTDRLAMGAALEAGGVTVGVLADSLERTVRQPDLRQMLLDGQLGLVTPYVPTAGFSVGAAMGRNKLIYGLADFAVVVSSDFQTGGTWAGAAEALKGGWCPVFVRTGADVPKGNRELLRLGAAPLARGDIEASTSLAEWLQSHARANPVERDLFDREAV